MDGWEGWLYSHCGFPSCLVYFRVHLKVGKTVNFMLYIFYRGGGWTETGMHVESSQFLNKKPVSNPLLTLCLPLRKPLHSCTSRCLLSQAQAEVAQFPELSSAKLKLCITADQLPVGGPDEPAAEILPPEVNRPAGETHAFQ